MNTSDRNELHEMYKQRLKDMFILYSYDLVIELQKEEANSCSMQQIYNFSNQWVEDHIIP